MVGSDTTVWRIVANVAVSRNDTKIDLVTQPLDDIRDRTERTAGLESRQIVVQQGQYHEPRHAGNGTDEGERRVTANSCAINNQKRAPTPSYTRLLPVSPKTMKIVSRQ